MNEKNKKQRLDQELFDRGLVSTKSKASALILSGQVKVGDQVVSKAGHFVKAEDAITIIQSMPYVSRGGLKLQGALEKIQLDPKDKLCLDVGASTGGFTDCLLQKGAKHVCCIDVGKGQLHPKIRNHTKVSWKESFHVKELRPTSFDHLFDLVVVDVSFISIQKVLPFLLPCMEPDGDLLVMLKPQFESQRKYLHKGVVTSEEKRQEILSDFTDWILAQGQYRIQANADAPIKGPKGNQETFFHLKKAN
ncbi:MAG: TlyA family RNA methyltransferase [Bdellovibrionales bacterium]|nr:TlyA family RNA methyltransferase [Bdellovibrionales bacterium]